MMAGWRRTMSVTAIPTLILRVPAAIAARVVKGSGAAAASVPYSR